MAASPPSPTRHSQVAHIAMTKAKQCLEENNDGMAFANFLLVFKLAPHLHSCVSSEFLECMGRWCGTLREAGRSEDLLKCLHEACSVLPDEPHVLNTMGTELFNLRFLDEAASYFRKALRADTTFLLARSNLQNLCSHVIERWHFRMLNDITRNKAYKSALMRAMQAGYDCVLDVGSGTGLLSMYAVEVGAQKIYGCEVSKVMYDISLDCVIANDMEEDVTLIHKASTDLIIPHDVPQRVSLLVTETFDAGLLGEHILSTLSHAWKHLLDTEHNKIKVIPQTATVYVCAIESEWLRKQHRVIYPGVRYLEFGSCEFVCTTSTVPQVDNDSEPYTSHRLTDIPGGYKLLTPVTHIQQFHFDDPKAVDEYCSGFSHDHTMTFTSPGHLDALVMWFDLDLDDMVTLTSAPAAGSCWEQAVYPVLPRQFNDVCDSLNVGHGDELTFCVACHNNALHIKPSKLHRHSADAQMENIVNSETTCDISDNKTIFNLSREEISAMNDLNWNQAYCHALEEIQQKFSDKSSFTILFILHEISMLPLQALKLGAHHICVVTQNTMVKNVLSHVVEENGLSLDSVEFVRSVEDVEGKWNVLVTNLVETCGSLRSQILEEIALARMTCLPKNGYIIPQSVDIYGVLVESESLLQDACVVSSEQTLGVDVGFINDFKMTQHVDIHLATLKHQKLSIPFNLLTFDLSATLDENSDLENTFLHQDQNLSISVAETGTITGVIYWFDLMLTPSVPYSTLDSSSHIHQAAILQGEPLGVNAGTYIDIRTLCKNSCIDVTLSTTS